MPAFAGNAENNSSIAAYVDIQVKRKLQCSTKGTCWSRRPRNSRLPSGSQRARSPGARNHKPLQQGECTNADIDQLAAAKHSRRLAERRPRPTGAVHAAVVRVAARERVGDKLLGGQVRPLQVAARQLDAADHQLARDANGQRIQVLAQDVAAQVGQRDPDRHGRAAGKVARFVACTAMNAGHGGCAAALQLALHAHAQGQRPPVDATVASVGP